MKIKDLFEESGNKVLDGVTAQDLVNRDDVESRDYITAWKERINRVVPAIDFSKPENFAFYGSGEKYYENSFNHILRSYPYDGSKAERISWENSSSFLDLWVYDNLYPKQTGYVTLNPSGTDITFGGTTGWMIRMAPVLFRQVQGHNMSYLKEAPTRTLTETTNILLRLAYLRL